jgi:hypothetical protein
VTLEDHGALVRGSEGRAKYGAESLPECRTVALITFTRLVVVAGPCGRCAPGAPQHLLICRVLYIICIMGRSYVQPLRAVNDVNDGDDGDAPSAPPAGASVAEARGPGPRGPLWRRDDCEDAKDRVHLQNRVSRHIR